MNPCPCGYLGEVSGRCHCTPDQISRYLKGLSKPLMECIDMRLIVAGVPRKLVMGQNKELAEPSTAVCRRVIAARQRVGTQPAVEFTAGRLGTSPVCTLNESANNSVLPCRGLTSRRGAIILFCVSLARSLSCPAWQGSNPTMSRSRGLPTHGLAGWAVFILTSV